MNHVRVQKFALIGLMAFFILAVFVVVFAISTTPSVSISETAGFNTVFVQDTQTVPDPDIDGIDVAVSPATAVRISWGAVIAGTLLTLALMFMFNLLGFSLGVSQIHPEYGEDSASPGELATGAAVWIMVSNLIALFVGGWVAAYFAGIPDNTDGLLHGLMVWAVSGIVTVLFVMSGVGRLMSGFAGLVSNGLNLAGSVAGGAAHAAGGVAGGVAHAAGNVAGGVGNLAGQTLSTLAHGVQTSAQMTASGLSNLSDTAIENSPDVQNALSYQDLTLEDIRMQAEQLMRQAGEDPNRVQQQAQGAVQDVKQAAQAAVRNPDHAGQILNIALQRVLRRGQSLASDVDRNSLVDVLAANSNMSREEAARQVQKWEEQFNQVKGQTDQARGVARQRAEELRQQAEQKAQEVYDQAQTRAQELQQEVENRLMQARMEAEAKAREAAAQARTAFSRAAAALAVAMVIGAIAAGLGGYIGAPETIPTAELEDDTTQVIPDANVSFSVLPQLWFSDGI
jgi:vacuolar-type H+-ATPase subunit H